MNRKSIFRAMVAVVLLLTVSISMNAQTKSSASDAEMKEIPVLKLSYEKLSLEVGQSEKIVIKDEISEKEVVTWTSSDKEVIAVDSNGVVKANKIGKATITATVGKREGKCEVVVEKDSAAKSTKE